MKVRLKLLLIMASAVLVALILSGCFLLPGPTVHFIAPSNVNVQAYPTNQLITFKWIGSSNNLQYTLMVTRTNSTPVTLLSKSSTTEFSTTLVTPGAYTAKIVAKDKTTGKEGINATQFDVTSLEILTSTPTYAVDHATINWKSFDGKTHTYLYTIDDATWVATSATSVVLTNLKDGYHTFQVKIKNSLVPAAKYTFQILTAGPTLFVKVSDRTEGGLYGIGSRPQGRFANISWVSNQKLGMLLVRFFLYDESGTGKRYILNINPNGTWQELPPTSKDQKLYLIDTSNKNMVVSATKYGSIPVYDLNGNEYKIPKFEFGKVYGVNLIPVNWLGTMGALVYTHITLSERYSDSDIPQMYVSYDKTTVATGDTFTAYVDVPHVTAYASGSHEIINDPVDHTDITSNNGLMYTEFSLKLAPGLKLNKVEFPDMISEKVNLSHYTYDATSGILTVYRGFVESTTGATTATSATDIAVEVQCTVPSTYTGSLAYVGLIYEGNFDAEGYSNLNPIFKDNSNRLIDGIVTVPENTGVVVANDHSM